MKKLFIALTCLLLLVPLVQSQQSTYYGSVEAGLNLAKQAIADSLSQASRLDSLIIKDGSLSISDIANGNNGFLQKAAFDDSLGNPHTTVDITADEFFGVNLYDEGMLASPTITDGAGVTVSITAADVLIRSTTDFSGSKLFKFTVPQNTALAVTASSINYIYVAYNSGSPIYAATTTIGDLNYSSAIPVSRITMGAADIEYQVSYGATGLAPGAKNAKRVMLLRGIERESGLALTETATKIVNIASGHVFFGNNHTTLDAIVMGVGGAVSEAVIHRASAWVDSTVTTYITDYYDNGTAMIELTANRYAVNWVWRNVAGSEIDITMGTGDYTLQQALSNALPTAPEKVSAFYILVGRIIVQKGATTAYSIQSVRNISLTTAGVTAHTDLSGLTSGDDHTQYLLETAFDDSVKTWLTKLLPMPDAFDTTGTGSGLDSLTVTPFMKAVDFPDSSNFLRAQGNGTALADTVKGGVEFQNVFGDSLIVFVRADTSAVVVKVNISLKGYNGDTALNAVVVYPTAINTWERKAFVLATPMKQQEYLLTYQFICTYSHWIDITRARLK